MNKLLKLFLVIISIAGMPYVLLAGNRDTIIHDTLTLSQDKIIPVALQCNGPDELIKITSFAELQKIFGSNCPPSPTVDFTREFLLYFPTKSTGCKTPDYIRTIKIKKDTLTYHILIVQHGGCDILLLNQNCIAIPKIYSDYKVDFKYDVIIKNQ